MPNIMIVREAMNTDRAHALGLIFKLQIYFQNPGQPRIEVFFNNDVTRNGELDWAIYGAADYDRPDLCRNLEFEGLNETRHFELGGSYHIKFTQMSLEEVNYRRIGRMLELAYHFHVDRCDT